MPVLSVMERRLYHTGPNILVNYTQGESKSLKQFKNKIKAWKAKKCPCLVCKVCIGGVGFIVSVVNTNT